MVNNLVYMYGSEALKFTQYGAKRFYVINLAHLIISCREGGNN